jgi:hypothetical protein
MLNKLIFIATCCLLCLQTVFAQQKREPVWKQKQIQGVEKNSDPEPFSLSYLIDYPVPVRLDTTLHAPFNRLVGRKICELLYTYLGDENQTLCCEPGYCAKTFARKYVTLDLASYPGQEHTFNLEIKQMHTWSHYSSFSLNLYAFLGGAHGTGMQEYLTLDMNTMQVIKLEDLIGDRNKLIRIAEARFRAEKKINTPHSLEPYFFTNNQFYLPDAWGLSQEGLTFTYQAHAIASYAEGPISLTIPYKALKGVLRNK